MTEAMNRIEISGTPRTSSMKPTQVAWITGMSARRPSASRIESGKANAMPKVLSSRLRISPPQRSFST